MLEYLSYKKFKKHRAEKEGENAKGKEPETAKPEQATSSGDAVTTPATPSPVLHDDEQAFLERLTSYFADDHGDDEGSRPALPPRVKTPDLTWDSDSESFRKVDAAETTTTTTATVTADKDSDKEKKPKKNRISLLLRSKSKKSKKENSLTVPTASSTEAAREEDDLSRVLDELSLSAKNNRAFSVSEESTELLRRFTQVLKDLVNGVPTAVGDLTSLLDDPDGLLAKNFEKLPSSLQKLVTQLPEKLSTTLAPELLAAAAEAQGLSKEEVAVAAGGGIAGAAKRMLNPKNIKDLVTKPGAIVSMLKAIMNALKVRWPAFMGTNVIWSLALFLLLFVLWYCHKRGREVRLEKEKSENVGTVDGSGRIEELPDDPALPAPVAKAATATTPIVVAPPKETA